MKLIWLCCFIFYCSELHGNKISIVVSKDTHLDEATKTEIVRMYLGKIKVINGVQLIPVDYKAEDSSLVINFRKKILRKNKSKFKIYWSSQIFTGKGTPPRAVAESQEEMIQYIINNPGTIGFIDSSKLNQKVKELYCHE